MFCATFTLLYEPCSLSEPRASLFFKKVVYDVLTAVSVGNPVTLNEVTKLVCVVENPYQKAFTHAIAWEMCPGFVGKPH